MLKKRKRTRSNGNLPIFKNDEYSVRQTPHFSLTSYESWLGFEEKRCGDFIATYLIFSGNIKVSDIKGRSTYLRVLFSPKKCITTTDRNAGNLQNFGMTGRAFHEISTLSQNFYLQLKVHLWNPFDPFLRSLPRSKTICDGANRFWKGLKF